MTVYVSMPVRAFLDSDIPQGMRIPHTTGFNARQGIS